MKYKIIVFLLIFSSFLSHAQSSLQVSSADVSFIFENNNVKGTLSGFSSSSTIDMNDLENIKLKGSVQLETISTGNSIRDWSLRRSKYFDADTYPKISFESTSIQIEGDSIKVIGQLTIKDVTKELALDFAKNEKKLIGTAVLFSSDYGIHIKNKREQNKVEVKIILHLKP